MIRSILFTLVLLFPVFGLSQSTTAFERANSLYNDGKYNEAIIVYQSILDSQKHSAELYFNLANCHYKLSQIGPSVYYYEKALLLDPNDKDTLTNLQFAQNMTVDEIETIPELGFAKFFNRISNLLTSDQWATCVVCASIIFVLFFVGYYWSFSSRRKRSFFIGCFVVISFGLSALVLAYKKVDLDKSNRLAILFSPEVEVKTEPNLRSETSFILHEGTKVHLIERFQSDWVKIRLSDGKTGWVTNQDVKAL